MACKRHKAKYDGAKFSCITCINYDPNEEKCRVKIWLNAGVIEPEGNREAERLMRHDGYERGRSGGIRQVRRGS